MATSAFRLYNTMSKQKEVFKARVGGKVGMYVCGVTAYALSHLGHARAAVAFDVLYRYLQHSGYEVTYVRNFTDVDDKIIRRANEDNEISENPLDLSSHFCQEYLNDMADLQCLPPTHQPRVSDHMDQIKDMITQIINNDCAYTVDGDVYFSVDEFPNYGRLSGRKLEDNRAGERVAIDSRKHNPADFALWKAAKPGEPSWDSPWGPGRPGWHIECSAMSAHYLSSAFDIHGGGMDLIFPHHENEIAQSCAACQESNVSYWMHNGHVTNNNEKMSKSLGNFFTIREITKLYHPLALRHFLMSTHYRSQVNYSISQLERASDSVFYIYQALQDCEDALSPFREGSLEGTEPNGRPAQITPAAQGRINKLRSEFQTMMSDDLQTTPILNDALLGALSFINSYLDMLKTLQECEDALSAFREGSIEGTERNGRLARITTAAQGCINKLRSDFQIKMSDDLQTTPKLNDALLDALSFIDSYLSTLKKQQKQKQLSVIQSPTELVKGVKQVQNVLIQSLNEVVKEVKLVLNILGLLSTSIYSEVLQQLKDKALKRAGLMEIELLNLIEERSVARKNKDFAKADKMRSDLSAKGISLMDGVAMETIWRPCVPPEHQQQAQPTAASS